MAHIEVKRGLDIPMSGKPAGEAAELPKPNTVALNLSPFEGIWFKLLKHAGDVVKIGEPLVEDKKCPGRVWVSPGSGTIKEVKRGLKRRLLDVVIELDDKETPKKRKALDPNKASPEEIKKRLLEGGIFPHIRRRPCNILANPDDTPRSIFIKAIESAPFVPSAEMQVEGKEELFQAGIDALKTMTGARMHIVYRKKTKCKAFTQAEHVVKHNAEGPHPVANQSLHIQTIDPINDPEAVVWTLSVVDVIAVGQMVSKGTYYTDRVVSLCGPGVLPERRGYFRARAGFPIADLMHGRTEEGFMRMISGDPLMGSKVQAEDFLEFYHTAFCVFPESVEREFLHFFRLGINKFSHSKTYLSGHLDSKVREYDFNTSLHGEHRGMIDASIYDRVMPMQIPTMYLVKAVIAEDYELAEKLGILEVDAEDFALPTFVCPSKTEMVEIMKDGLALYAAETIH